MIRVADYIMKRIVEEGVSHLFYVPGGQCVYLMDALRRAQEAGELTGISTHHEQAAAYAAIAYSQHTRNLGACLVTTGCAGTNTMTGLLHAWQDSIPCVFVSGQQNVDQTTHAYREKTGISLRQIGVQEADIVRLVEPVTKYAVMLTDPNEVAYEVDKVIYMAKEGRQGPTWIDVPLGIQNSMVDEERLKRFERYTDTFGKDGEARITGFGKPLLNDEDKNYIIQALNEAKRPILVAGNGIHSARAEKELRELVDKAHIPTVFSRLSIDLLETYHPYNAGCVSPVSGNRHANFAIQNADLVISIGCRLAIDFAGPESDHFAREAKIIVVDIDEEEHGKDGVKIDKLILADAGDVLGKLSKADISNGLEARDEWMTRIDHWKTAFEPYEYKTKNEETIDFKRFLHMLSKKLPDLATVVSDAGFTGAIVPANIDLKNGDRMIHSYAQGEMGFVIPGCFGTACADPKRLTVGITGDGSAMMNLQEFQTWVRNGFAIKLIINNNYGYSGVRHGQKAHFRGKSVGTDPSNGVDFPDFGKVAEAFGIDYFKIDQTSDIEKGLARLFGDGKPCICEVVSDPDQFDLHNALVMYGKRKFGFRPIEDQSPFLNRDVFYEEMIVEPLEESSGKPV